MLGPWPSQEALLPFFKLCIRLEPGAIVGARASDPRRLRLELTLEIQLNWNFYPLQLDVHCSVDSTEKCRSCAVF